MFVVIVGLFFVFVRCFILFVCSIWLRELFFVLCECIGICSVLAGCVIWVFMFCIILCRLSYTLFYYISLCRLLTWLHKKTIVAHVWVVVGSLTSGTLVVCSYLW